MMEASIQVFLAYAHEDEHLLKELENHLALLLRQGVITTWHDRNISAGTERAQEIDLHLKTAQIILLLISANFLASDYCYSFEMTQALKRHEAKEARVIPILLRPVDWEEAPFSHLQVLPTNAIPIADRRWQDHDEAFVDVAQGIRKVVKELRAKPSINLSVTSTKLPQLEPVPLAPLSEQPDVPGPGYTTDTAISQFTQAPFVGREDEQQLYQNFLTRDTPWVLIITGQGGNGKSTLLRHLAEQAPQNIRTVTLNFANKLLRTHPLKILEEFSEKLASACDAQRAAIFEKTLQDGEDRLLELGWQMNKVSHVGNDASLYGTQLAMQGPDAAVLREQRRQVLDMVTRTFYAQVRTFSPTRLVIMLDTCEWLSEAEGLEAGQWLMDELIPTIREHMQQRQRRLSVVIASRIIPSFSVIERQDQYTQALQMLEKAAVDTYLEQMGMQSAELRQQVYESTHGHALCVSIFGTLWQEQGDQPFTSVDFPQLQEKFNERALLEFIQDRLEKRLKTPFRELTKYGVLLRSFNLPMLQAVFPELLSGTDKRDQFDQLIRCPYIEHLGKQRYAFHDLLREIQAEGIREQEPEEWQRYHKRALDFLSQSQELPHAPDLYYHALACNEKQALLDWSQDMLETFTHDAREHFSTLLQVAYDKTLKLTSATCAERAYWQARLYYSSNFDVEKALESCMQALDLFHQVGNHLGEAKAWKLIGDLQQFRGDQETALENYEKASSLFRQEKNLLGEASVLLSKGDVEKFRDDLETALESYKQALPLFNEVGNRLGQAYVLQAIGDVQQFRDDREAALKHYEQALILFREVGSKVGQASVLLGIGDVQQSRKNMDAALESYKQALKLFVEVGDRLGQANVLQAMGSTQQARKDMSAALESYEQALTLFREVGSEAGQANCYLSQGQIAYRQKDYQKALDLHAKAYELYQRIQDSYSQAQSLFSRSFVYEARNERDLAVQDIDAALTIAQRLNLTSIDRFRRRSAELHEDSL